MSPLQSETGPRGADASRAIDWQQLRILLRLFFMFNSRGHLTRNPMAGAEQKPRSIVWTLLIYVLFGFFMGGVSLTLKTPFSFLAVLHAFTMMMTLMLAITESSQVLFNPQEEDILGHRPIGARTLLLAKALNLLGITGMVALALNVAPVFFIMGRYAVAPWAPLVHFATALLICVFSVASVVFIYGMLSRVVGPERFQTLVTWAQIVMMVLATFGYQFFGQVLGRIKVPDLEPYLKYLFALPPVWFAALEASLCTRGVSPAVLGLGAFGLALTLALFWLAARRMAGLQGRISGSLVERRPILAERPQAVKVRPAAVNPLLRAWLRDPVERGIFRLTATMLRRDRFIMQQVYPHLAFVLAYPLFMAFGSSSRHGGGGEFSGMMFLFLGFWMLIILPLTVMQALRTSENCEAALVFAIAPLERPARLFHGVRKAVLYYLMLPTASLLLAIFCFIAPRPLHDLYIAAPAFITLPLFALLPGLDGDYIPFSTPAQRGDKSSQVAKTFVSLFVILLIGGVAVIVYKFNLILWALLAEAPTVWLIHLAMVRRIERQPPLRIADGAL